MTIPEQNGWYSGGRRREECTCDNEGRDWTGQSAKSINAMDRIEQPVAKHTL